MPKGVCLSIGLNKIDPYRYYGASPLTGCHNDARQVAALAHAAGFAVLDTLLSEAATRAKVITSIRRAAADLASGDIFLLHYSGHGAQVPDTSGDESDRKDETWCLFDNMIIDDEFVPLWASFAPGVRIVVLSDSCHSGTISRAIKVEAERTKHRKVRHTKGEGVEPDGPIAIRALSDDAARETWEEHRAFYASAKALARTDGGPTLADVKATVLAMSACKDSQLASDIGSNGAFTRALLATMGSTGAASTYAELRKAIGRLTARYDQDPQLSMIGTPSAALPSERPFSIGV